MEAPTPKVSKRAKKKQRASNQKSKLRASSRKEKGKETQKKQTFYFLPETHSSKTKWALLFFPFSSVKAYQELQRLESPTAFHFQQTEEGKQELHNAVTKLLDVRWKFRRLVLGWRYKKARAANEVDPITLEPIQDPIRFYNIPLKIYYTFEKKSLSEYWRTNLKQSDGLIPTPRWPTNPLTNLPIHRTVLISIYEEFHSKGYTDSFLSSLAETRFTMPQWKLLYQIPLRMNAVRNTFRDKQSVDCVDYTYDFIELQHTIHSIPFCKKFYSWMFFTSKLTLDVHRKSECMVTQWIKICREYHEKEILILEPSEFAKELAKVYPYTKNLISKTLGLYTFFQQYIQERNARFAQTSVAYQAPSSANT